MCDEANDHITSTVTTKTKQNEILKLYDRGTFLEVGLRHEKCAVLVE